ncbi:hypothetical protein [Aquisphaera insulae]|uniref:hypothetical protein n=1 Tax=Aquisphaera insulae TaxID=2712864 RepID=UPI0013EB9D8B|nr:hypothetical protein [Aquisphaera insulae]
MRFLRLEWSKLVSVTVCLSAFCLLPNSLAEAGEPSTLHGFGRVAAAFGPTGATFDCEDVKHADWLMGKLLADFLWDATGQVVTKRIAVDAQVVTAHAWQPFGSIAVGRVGERVIVVGGSTEAELVANVRRRPELLGASACFESSGTYPSYLDFYDIRAFKLYTHAMRSVHGQGLASHWPFVRKYGLGGLGFQDLGVWTQNPAPGVLTLASTEYEVREAERQGGMVSVGITAGGEVPLWIHNAFASSMAEPSPTSLLGAWGGLGAAGAHYESWWMPLDQRRAGSLGMLRLAMSRFTRSPAVGGWHVYAGSPGAELGFHERTGEFWDYSPAGQAGFRWWLQNVKKYDLATLGRRWHGDASRFKSWDQVALPDVQGFFGALDEGGLRVEDGWQWRAATGPDDEAPPGPDAGWRPVAMPPSSGQLLLPWGASFYRVQFDPSEWLRKEKSAAVYLVCAAMIRSGRPIGLWLNGKALGPRKPESPDPAPFAVEVAAVLRAGRNELILRVPSGGRPGEEGKLFGPVFLTRTTPRSFPHLGEQANARFVDVKEWQYDSVIRYHESVLQEARGIDPDRPFVLSGGLDAWGDLVSDLCARHFGSIQMTGREAWYYPWCSGVGYVAGFYGASEPSATVLGTGLTRMLGWILLDGDSNHNLFWDIEDYIRDEKTSHWFEKHQRLLHLVGKSTREKPGVVILHSGRTHRLGSSAPWSWDMGRGDLQAAHIDNVYATEREVLNGQVDGYPVLLDAGTEFLDDDMVRAIERYVSRGGTFLALHNTGRHTSASPECDPMSRLSGFRVRGRERSGPVTFGKTLPILKSWQGRTFQGWDGLDLEPAADGATVLARWSDGHAAVGCRSIGKGRVILLGNTFWRGNRDHQRMTFETLFAEAGVVRNAVASTPDVWARKSITKNGLEEWLLAMNTKDGPVTADVSFRVSSRPDVVLDLEGRVPVKFDWSEDGWIRIRGMSFEPQGTRAFSVRRGVFAAAIPFWWAEKVKYWARRDGPRIATPEAHGTSQPVRLPRTLVFESWRFLADRDGRTSATTDWLRPDFDDAKWIELSPIPWNIDRDDLRDYRGIGLYRDSFNVPESWAGRRVVLCLSSFDTPIVHDEGEFLLNGRPVTTYRAHGWSQMYQYDVTDQIVPGENVLAVRVRPGKEFAGLSGGIWIQAEERLDPVTDLSRGWQIHEAPGRPPRRFDLPGTAKGEHLAREVEIPASWAGRSVLIHVETGTQWLGSIVVNGRPINYNGFQHPFGLRAEVNVTAAIRPGATNRIELWPFRTIPAKGPDARFEPAEIEVRVIRIGCAEERESS